VFFDREGAENGHNPNRIATRRNLKAFADVPYDSILTGWGRQKCFSLP